jgi:hypothetical protein
MKKYFWNLLISIDQMANALLAGNPDETLSSRMGKRVKTCALCRVLCDWLDRIDYRHCQKSIEWDEY